MAHLWIVYDERAAFGDTDDAAVLEACSSEHEAMHKALPGIVFRYYIGPGDQLVDETFIGPNKPLQHEQQGGV